ncbi:hypothetical protein AK812_SmicGene2526 [Symbiodinium microadriaticum]|uniref:Uncharacterized protein n=1 Tax=Symbiodinium microadriaticum TaxID=2951 RepID=A0A1Q9F1F3_SYMMI|nr:hypothetical protein AK812_SmicGene2526 [Symbiodinium microadriaticum]
MIGHPIGIVVKEYSSAVLALYPTYSLHCSSFLGNYNGDYRPYVECACELVCIMVASEGIKDKQAWNLIWGRLAWLKAA